MFAKSTTVEIFWARETMKQLGYIFKIYNSRNFLSAWNFANILPAAVYLQQ